MNQKSKFNRNFDTAIQKLMNCTQIELEALNFKLKPINEEMGKESSKDNWMKSVLKHNNLLEYKNYENTIRILSAGDSHYPLWIEVSKESDNCVLLEFSTRFRHIKTSHNQETNHPPFKLK